MQCPYLRVVLAAARARGHGSGAGLERSDNSRPRWQTPEYGGDWRQVSGGDEQSGGETVSRGVAEVAPDDAHGPLQKGAGAVRCGRRRDLCIYAELQQG